MSKHSTKKRVFTNALYASAASLALLASAPAYSMGCGPAGGAVGLVCNGGAGVCAVTDNQGNTVSPSPAFTVAQVDVGTCKTSPNNTCFVKAPKNVGTAQFSGANYNEACGEKLAGICRYWQSESTDNTGSSGPQTANRCITPKYICSLPENDPRVKTAQINGDLGAPCNKANDGVCVVHSNALLSADIATPCKADILCAPRVAATASGY